MALHYYLNIPEEIAEKIESKEEVGYLANYRFLYQKGDVLPTDFIPTFADEKQREIREKRKLCGGMANLIVSQHKELKPKLSDYSVSLFIDLEAAKSKLWRNESCKKDHPAIAVGQTNQDKGYATLSSDFHVSYFLFDYVNCNPYNDFRIVEEAKIDE